MTRLGLIMAPVLVVLLIGVFVVPISYHSVAANPGYCPPTNPSQINANFPVKLPQVVPTGFSLQGMEKSNSRIVELWYSDHDLCQFPHFDSTGIKLEIEEVKQDNTIGHAIFAKDGKEIGYNITKVPPQSSFDFQQALLKEARDPKFHIIADWKPVDINGYKGVGWNSYRSYDLLERGGKILNNSTITEPAGIIYLNDRDDVAYDMGGNLTLAQLLEVAKSIPQ